MILEARAGGAKFISGLGFRGSGVRLKGSTKVPIKGSVRVPFKGI